MAATPNVLLRLYAEFARLLQQQQRLAVPPLQRALEMLLLPEGQLSACSAAIRDAAEGTALGAEINNVIAAILVARFNGRTVSEICAMGGITTDDFTSSVAYREIDGQGHQEGGRVEAATLTLRLLQRRCGTISVDHRARIESLSLLQLEALADALLDFQGPDALTAWLAIQS